MTKTAASNSVILVRQSLVFAIFYPPNITGSFQNETLIFLASSSASKYGASLKPNCLAIARQENAGSCIALLPFCWSSVWTSVFHFRWSRAAAEGQEVAFALTQIVFATRSQRSVLCFRLEPCRSFPACITAARALVTEESPHEAYP